MSILVVGSVAFDTVTTPSGHVRDALGGSASHFAVSASFFTPVRLVAVVGEDFTDGHRQVLLDRKVDLAGLTTAKGRTFRWSGAYEDDLNTARTLATELNVFADFRPDVPHLWRDTPILFLANIDPVLQWEVLEQVKGAKLVAADTMNYWIAGKPDALKKLLGRIDILLINDGEIRQLTGEGNVVRAAEAVRRLGPRAVVVKRGEHGVVVFHGSGTFALPALPLAKVMDPTGAGDAFAGGFLGYIASQPADAEHDLRRAAVVGSVMASFQVEDFSLDRLKRLTEAEIKDRYAQFQELTQFKPLS